jgi:lipopolysaccharide assembly protein A
MAKNNMAKNDMAKNNLGRMMQFLKTIFWAVIAVAAAIFAFNNWTPVTINLWNGMQMDTRLPLLLLFAFMIGLLPTFLLHRATRWSLRRKLDSAERALADTRAPVVAPAPAPINAPIIAPTGAL